MTLTLLSLLGHAGGRGLRSRAVRVIIRAK